MNKILTFTFIFLGFTINEVNAQCSTLQLTAVPSNPCQGESVTLTTSYSTIPSNHFFDFNTNTIPSGWSSGGGTNFSNNICGSSLDNTPYFWASTSVGTPQIVTADFDICTGGTLQFDMKYAVQGVGSPCEGPDEQDEGVSMEYSLDGGVTWIEFIYYSPGGFSLTNNPGGNTTIASGNTAYTSWNTFNVPIPAAAISASTRFRWVQSQSSGGCCDNWGLDNISVLAGPCVLPVVSWSNGAGNVMTQTYIAQGDSTFTVNILDENDTTVILCTQSINVPVNLIFNYPLDITICQGETYMFGPTSSSLLPYTSAGSYPVTFSTVHGCDSIITLNLTVNPILNTAMSQTVCQGESVTLGAQTFNSSGSYPVTFASAVTGCDSIMTLNLTVTPTPSTPNLTSNSPICDTEDILLTSDSGPGSTYFWTGPQSYSSGVDDPVIQNASPPHSGTYSLYIIQSNCTSATQSVNVVVNPLPAEPDYISNSPICEGQNIVFNGNASPTANYFWSGPNAWISTFMSPTIIQPTASASGAYELYIVELGCTSATHIENVIVNNKPTILYTGPTQVCGNVVNLTASAQVDAPSQLDTYFWSGSGSSIGQGQTLNHTFSISPYAHVNGTAIVETDAGCRDTATYSVELNTIPVADFIEGPPCTGLDISFNNGSNWNGSAEPGSLLQYNWSFGDSQTSTVEDPDHTYQQEGNYQVTLIVSSSSSICTDTITKEIKVSELPISEFSVVEQCFQNMQFISNSSAPNSVITGVDWDFGDGAFLEDLTGQTQYHEYANPGNYDVTLTIENQEGCLDVYTMAITVKQSKKLADIEIPNIITPNGDGINNELLMPDMEACNEYTMQIFNRWGSLMYTQVKGATPFRGLDTKGAKLTTGVYFYVIKADDITKNGTITIAY